MFKFVRSRSLFAAFVCLFAVAGAHAQSTPETPGQRQLDRMDFGITAVVDATRSTSGKVVNDQSVSTPVGALFTLRYTKSPWVGAEMNYRAFVRSTQNYTYTPADAITRQLGVQSNNTELSWGYVAHTPNTYFGLQPFGGAGVGTLEFKPTPAGGVGLIRQFRAGYYWNVGADYTIPGSHFGMRVQFRQVFYLAPDFGQSYLTSGSRTSTFEPAFGFFAHF
jgi:hypothetical protein